MEYTLECKDLSKRYATGSLALDAVQLQLQPGRIVGLLGPNGSGKTTLIKLACGLLQPTGGQVLAAGYPPGVQSKARVSYLPERESLPRWMKAEDTVDYFADFYEDFDAVKSREMLARLGIDPKTRLKTMSKGTREKMHLALVMSRRSDLYLLDEPIGGVDPAARDYILETIITNYREQATVVISTHLIADIEKVLDEVVFIKQGTVLRHTSVDELRQNYNKSVDALFREEFRC